MVSAFAVSGWADDSDLVDKSSNLNLQGFISVIGGEVLSGSFNGNLGGQNYKCPCYVADWANAGVYTRDFSLKPQSHVGLQADYTINPQLSLTGQVIIRGTETNPSIQYAFADYKIDEQWDVHIGRERIPLFYYSIFQDLGLAYPWISPPSEVYGWEATNYNGISARYKGSLNGVSVGAELYTGFEYIHQDVYLELNSYPQSEVHWKNMIGGTVELSHDFWTVRGNAMTSQVNWEDQNGTPPVMQRIRLFGAAVNLDFDNWFVVSEAGEFDRNFYSFGYTELSPFYTVGVGVRFGAWTPVFNYAKFFDHYTYQKPGVPIQGDDPYAGWGMTLRYDIDTSSAIKIQYDKVQDLSPESNFFGNSKVLRLSYDRVF